MDMLDVMNMPVTLVVKAPNQRIEDQKVECMLGWTVHKLKTHLSEVYPSQPKENQQKLIYSGQLLHDHLTLKDVLRKYDDETPTHTVHLVCNHMALQEKNKATTQQRSNHQDMETQQRQTDNTTQHAASSTTTSTDGLRHRTTTVNSTTESPQPQPATPQNPYLAFQQMYSANAGMMMGMQPAGGMAAAGGMMAYTPQQMAWMQHMYAQQMAHYMQYYQQNTNQTQVHSAQPMNQAAPNVLNQADNQARPANPQQPEIVRMNAQGGPAMDDDDENVNRDWLDWIYTLCRVFVLLSIVYFYSTFSRFLMVFGFFFFVYLYQVGFFRIRRRQVVPDPQPAADPPAAQPPAENQENIPEGTDEDETTPAEETPQEPPPPPPPSALSVAWSFFITFFSSLIPQQPGQVNAN